MNQFKVQNSVAFCTFTVWYKHCSRTLSPAQRETLCPQHGLSLQPQATVILLSSLWICRLGHFILRGITQQVAWRLGLLAQHNDVACTRTSLLFLWLKNIPLDGQTTFVYSPILLVQIFEELPQCLPLCGNGYTILPSQPQHLRPLFLRILTNTCYFPFLKLQLSQCMFSDILSNLLLKTSLTWPPRPCLGPPNLPVCVPHLYAPTSLLSQALPPNAGPLHMPFLLPLPGQSPLIIWLKT